MAFLGSAQIVHHFDDLAATVRRGSIAKEESSVCDENPVWQTFARAMMPMMMPPAQAIAEILNVAAAGPIRVLDIAAGHGIFGIVIAQRNAQADVVAVDWAGVLQVATENATKMGVAARHKALPGDAFKVDWGTGYDIALMTNFLHHFDTPTCTTLLKKVAGSLKPGGRVAVLEFVPNEDRRQPARPRDVRDADARRHAVGRRLHARRAHGDAEGGRLRHGQRPPAPRVRRAVVVGKRSRAWSKEGLRFFPIFTRRGEGG